MRVAVITVVLCNLAALAPADPVSWTENGHWYEFVPFGDTQLTWLEAEAAAQAREWPVASGNFGHLITFTSQAETDWVFANAFDPDSVEHPARAFIGLFQDPEGAEPDEGWQWVTGEPLVWTNWAPGEPSESFSGEDYGKTYLDPESQYYGTWNDVRNPPSFHDRSRLLCRVCARAKHAWLGLCRLPVDGHQNATLSESGRVVQPRLPRDGTRTLLAYLRAWLDQRQGRITKEIHNARTYDEVRCRCHRGRDRSIGGSLPRTG